MEIEPAAAPSQEPDSGLACLALVARFHGKAAQPPQLAHELGLSGRARAEDILRAARRLELKARLGPIDLQRGGCPFPASSNVAAAMRWPKTLSARVANASWSSPRSIARKRCCTIPPRDGPPRSHWRRFARA